MSWLSSAFKKATGISITQGALIAGSVATGNPALAAAAVPVGQAQQANKAPAPAAAPAAAPTQQGQVNVSPTNSEPWQMGELMAKARDMSQSRADVNPWIIGLAVLALVFVLFLQRK